MNSIVLSEESTLHRILRHLMQEAGILESELARQTGLPQTTVNRLLLGGTSDPRAKTLKPIADYFGVTIGMLCGYESLPKNRVHGTVNMAMTPAWKAIPIIGWEAVVSWASEQNEFNPLTHDDWIATERRLSDASFALKSLAVMEPRFSKNSVLIVDPNAEYNDGHFIIVAFDGSNPTIRQVMHDGAEILLKSFDHSLPVQQLTSECCVFGTVIESRTEHYHE